MIEPEEVAAPARPIIRWLASLLFASAVMAAGYTSTNFGAVGGTPETEALHVAGGGDLPGGGPTAPDAGRAYGVEAETPLVRSQSEPRGRTAPEAPPLPVGVAIERIGLASQLVRLGLTDTGELQVPTGQYYDYAGWYQHGAIPGEAGSAVIAGHLDSETAPSVFHRLRDVVPGDVVLIDRADGSVVRFVVDRVEQYSKEDFPTSDVYGPTPDAQLRLITCGGAFDRDTGGYGDNLIVFASRA